jgi:hypothetical protein
MKLRFTVAVGLFVIAVIAYRTFEFFGDTAQTRVTEAERAQTPHAVVAAPLIEQPFQESESKMDVVESHRRVPLRPDNYVSSGDGIAPEAGDKDIIEQARPEHQRDMLLLPPEANDPGFVYAAPESGDPGNVYSAPEADDPGIEYSSPEHSKPQ